MSSWVLAVAGETPDVRKSTLTVPSYLVFYIYRYGLRLPCIFDDEDVYFEVPRLELGLGKGSSGDWVFRTETSTSGRKLIICGVVSLPQEIPGYSQTEFIVGTMMGQT